ncbi:MAG TPA: hypothetical protein VKL19_11245 [Thermoanaerobaculia bacterium]|nr:hypothetical protein [Thermoanaerobaculia bacterium]
MGRYIKKFARVGHSLGPSEERGFALWVGYDIEDRTGDLLKLGLINVDGWPEDELRSRGVTTFTSVAADDAEMREKLGLK